MSFDLHSSTEVSSSKPPFLEKSDQPLERPRSAIAEAVITRVDKMLPRKPVEYGKEAQAVVDKLRGTEHGIPNSLHGLSVAVEIVMTGIEMKLDKEEGKLLFDRADTKIPIDVLPHPHELTVMLKALYYLAKVAGEQPDVIKDVFANSQYVRDFGEAKTTLSLLSALDRLHVIEHPVYAPLASALRRHLLIKMRLRNYDDLAKTYRGPVVENREFWETGFHQVHDIQMPNNEALLYQRRNIANKQRRVRELTPTQMVRKNILTRGKQTAEIVQEYKGKPNLNREIQADINRMIFQETKDWRAALKPFTARIGTFHDEIDFIYKGILELARSFNSEDRSRPDKDLSRKSKSLFEDLNEDERKKRIQSKDEPEADPLYAQKLKEYLAQALNDDEPLIMWFLAFRNETAAFLLERSVQQDPERFIDLEKLIIHQLSKAGLLQQKGEQDILLRSSVSSDDQLLKAELPYFLQRMRFLAQSQTERAFDPDLNYMRMSGQIRSCTDELNSPNDNPLLELISEENLMQLTRESALDRFGQFVTGAQVSLDLAMVNIRLKSKDYRKSLAGSWWKNPDLTAWIHELRAKFVHRKKESNEDGEKMGNRETIGKILYSKERITQYDDLPFIPLDYDDDLVRNFLYYADGYPVAVDPQGQPAAPITELNTILDKARQSAEGGILYITPLHDNKIPIYSGYTFNRGWRINAHEWVVAAQKKTVKEYSAGVVESSVAKNVYEPYVAEDAFDFDAAKAYLETLAKDARLSEVYRNLIAELHTSNIAAPGEYRRIVLEHLSYLHRYIEQNRYYDDTANDKQYDGDALQYMANNPTEGFRCEVSARIVKAFLNSVGVRASVLVGEQPYYYQGRAIKSEATSHAKCIVIFPNDNPVEIDFTPPITGKTPNNVRQMFIKVPYGNERVKTRFNKETFSDKGRHLFKKARIALAIGVAVVGIKFAVFPDTGSFRLPFDLQTSSETTPVPVTSSLEELGIEVPDAAPTQTTAAEASDAPTKGKGETQVPVESPSQPETSTEDEPFEIDLSQIEWGKIGLGLMGVLSGTLGFLYAYEKVQMKRNEAKWKELNATFIEKNYRPPEQILMNAAFHTIQSESQQPEKVQAALLRVHRTIKNFDWEAAQPLLEITALRLNEGDQNLREQLVDLIAKEEYATVYDILAKEMYLAKESGSPSLSKKYAHQKQHVAAALISRGWQVVYAENHNVQLPPLSLSTAELRMFSKSMNVIQIMQDFKSTIAQQLEMFKMTVTLSTQDDQQRTSTLEQRANQLSWNMKSRVLGVIRQMERSLAGGAAQLLTPEELKQMADEFAQAEREIREAAQERQNARNVNRP